MTQTNPVPDPGATLGAPYLDCERLDCCRVAVEFQVLAAGICRKPRLGSIRDQLDRASVSIALNLAEGAGRTTEGVRPNAPRPWISSSPAASSARPSIATLAGCSSGSSR